MCVCGGEGTHILKMQRRGSALGGPFTSPSPRLGDSSPSSEESQAPDLAVFWIAGKAFISRVAASPDFTDPSVS